MKMKMVYSLSFLIKEWYDAEVTHVASNEFHMDIAWGKKRIKKELVWAKGVASCRGFVFRFVWQLR